MKTKRKININHSVQCPNFQNKKEKKKKNDIKLRGSQVVLYID